MRAMRLHELGRNLQLDQVKPPSPGSGQVLLDIQACGINFADTLMVKGRYQERPDLPFSPGMELCGTVRETDDSVDASLIGRRVAAFTGFGGLAEQAIVSAAACVPVPNDMPDPIAAGFMIAYGTSHVALDYRARLQPGETLLVLGAAGGVGLTAVELGKLMGARVIAGARGVEKLEVARKAGADHLIDSATADLKADVRALGGADVIYDPVGGDLFKAALGAAKPEARILPLGFASGDIPQIPANIVLVKNLSILGLYWGGYAKLKPAVLTDSLSQLMTWYAEGRLHPHVSHILPLDQANEALALLRDRKATGKVIVTMT